MELVHSDLRADDLQQLRPETCAVKSIRVTILQGYHRICEHPRAFRKAKTGLFI